MAENKVENVFLAVANLQVEFGVVDVNLSPPDAAHDLIFPFVTGTDKANDDLPLACSLPNKTFLVVQGTIEEGKADGLQHGRFARAVLTSNQVDAGPEFDNLAVFVVALDVTEFQTGDPHCYAPSIPLRQRSSTS